jgi:hypothetical protein
MNELPKSNPPFSDNDKIVESIEGIDKFSKSLGQSDVYREILLEELFKILMKQ